ncbi:PilN domain-containing protein [Desulforamulus ruminis]|uniref:PilN domain-containing protein n=1 Tax=Desulforamulus ruminis TaxID=1564 RepID=UPI002356AA87|nr:PilN domain-containing protein [Desulforamulus ruminis]
MNYRINLLPVELQPKQPVTLKKLKVYIISALVVGGLGFFYGYFMWQLRSVQEELQALQPRQEQLEQIESRIRARQQEKIQIQEKMSVLNGLLEQRKTWPKFLLDLNDHVPEGVWISTLYLTDGSLQQEGSDGDGQSKEEKDAPEKEDAVDQPTEKENQKEEAEVPESAPNQMLILGGSYSMEEIGKFIFSLNQMSYFSEVRLEKITMNEEGRYTYHAMAFLKEGQP